MLKVIFWCIVALLLSIISLDRLHWLIYDKAWINPFHEGFAWTFLPAIKMESANDYWYHYFGLTGLPIVTRLLHWIARTAEGSSELTLDYAFLFGKLYFSFIYIAIVFMCVLIIRWTGWRFGFPILMLLLMLNYLDPFSAGYHKIVNTLGFFELYLYAYTALTVYIITRFRVGTLHRHATWWLAAMGGGLAGSLFFDLAINGWLFLFFMAALLSVLRGAERWRCATVAVVSGIVVGPLLLWVAYGFHITQTSIALVHHLYVITHGVGITQLDFEQFLTLFLSPKANYFQWHVVMVCAGAIWTIGVFEQVLRSGRNTSVDGETPWRRLLLSLDIIFAVSVAAFVYALYRQPTSTVVDSLMLLCLVYIGYRLFVALCASEAAESMYRRWFQLASAVTVIGVGASVLPYYERGYRSFPFMPHHLFFSDRIEGRVVRSLDQLLNRFAEQYTVIESPDSYWMMSFLFYSLRSAGDLFFTGSGLPGGPRLLPLEPEVEREYVRRYRFVNHTSVVSVSDNCQAPGKPPAEYADRLQGLVDTCATLSSPLGSKVLNMGGSRVPLGREVYLLPFPIPAGKAIYDRAPKNFAWRVTTDSVDSEPTSPRRLLPTENNTGIRHEVYRVADGYWGWSLMPVDLETVKSSLTPLAMPLAEAGYRGYLLQVSAVYIPSYILILVRTDMAP
jgi:hypothetical protein